MKTLLFIAMIIAFFAGAGHLAVIFFWVFMIVFLFA